jgi:hypothetical protein
MGSRVETRRFQATCHELNSTCTTPTETGLFLFLVVVADCGARHGVRDGGGSSVGHVSGDEAAHDVDSGSHRGHRG